MVAGTVAAAAAVIAALVAAALQHPKLQQQLASYERWLKLWLAQQQQQQ
jgi:hypothetical protein